MSSWNYSEAAGNLGIKETWLRRNIRTLPHHKVGRTVVFYEDDLALIKEQTAIRPTTAPVIDKAVLTALGGIKPSSRSRRRS